MFVFRNYTVENLFDESTRFSGYADISEVPDAEIYIWFYNVPFVFNSVQLIREIEGIGQQLELISGRIPNTKSFYILTLENLFPLHYCDSDTSVAEAIASVNRIAYEIAARHSNVRVIDFSDFLSQYKPTEWINWRFYFISQMVISPTIAPAFKEWFGTTITRLTGTRKKCLVLDLDNTLWSGVLGEDGISGVKMSGDYPGNAFMYFQQGLKALADDGVILTVCSKNNETDVKELWEKNPFVIIGPKLISAYRINWNNKADNIRELAQELNIGLDSMVFVDDNPTERELVRQQLPMVEVPEFPKKPHGLMPFYAELVDKYFRAYRLSEEDRKKTEQYRANAQRADARSHFTDMAEFIRSLNIEIEIIRANEFNIPRIAQMTQKTNQFNLTTHRYTEADINNFVGKGSEVFCISVSDKFGSNGITGAIIINISGEKADIDSLLLSCRILGKDIETAFVKSVLNTLHIEGVREVSAKYLPTAKNAQVSDFYDRIGFRCIGINEGTKDYYISLETPFEISDSYKIQYK